MLSCHYIELDYLEYCQLGNMYLLLNVAVESVIFVGMLWLTRFFCGNYDCLLSRHYIELDYLEYCRLGNMYLLLNFAVESVIFVGFTYMIFLSSGKACFFWLTKWFLLYLLRIHLIIL